MITVTGAVKYFGTHKAVGDVSFSVKKGEIFGLIGPDGAGKTTLIRMILGLAAKTSGEIKVLEKDDIESVKGRIGYVKQNFSLYGELSVMENIRLIGGLYGLDKKETEKRAEEILTFSGLWPFKDRFSDKLSGGMKQKLMLSAALIHRPELLFLDEPSTGVDPVSRREFWEMIYKLNKGGATVVLSTPYMDEAEQCGRIAFMNHGKITAIGAPEELKAAYPYQVIALNAELKNAAFILKECFIKEINFFGGSYHLVADDGDKAIEAVRAALKINGVTIGALEKISPSLEDVFIALA